MIIPINEHLLIEPEKHESFLTTNKETFEEIGRVIALQPNVAYNVDIKIGTRVFFDSWMCAKYPTGVDDKYYWFVRFSDIRAIENDEPVSK